MKKRSLGLSALLMALAVLLCTLFPGASLAQSWEDRILTAADDLLEDGEYTDLDHVAAYLVFYGTLPSNYITKAEAKKLGWKNAKDLWDYAPGCSVGGDAFGNREGLLPKGDWYECDLFYAGGERGSQRLVYNEEGTVYYTDDGYKSFTLVYPSEEEALIPNASPTPSPTAKAKAAAKATAAPKATATPYAGITVEKNGTYSDKEHVALYIHLYGKLPSNYITKSRARDLGWDSSSGNLWRVSPGSSIGGDRFGNYEGKLPTNTTYKECDIDYDGGYRNAKRIIYGADGSVYYTEDHYNTFERLY